MSTMVSNSNFDGSLSLPWQGRHCFPYFRGDCSVRLTWYVQQFWSENKTSVCFIKLTLSKVRFRQTTSTTKLNSNKTSPKTSFKTSLKSWPRLLTFIHWPQSPSRRERKPKQKTFNFYKTSSGLAGIWCPTWHVSARLNSPRVDHATPFSDHRVL